MISCWYRQLSGLGSSPRCILTFCKTLCSARPFPRVCSKPAVLVLLSCYRLGWAWRRYFSHPDLMSKESRRSLSLQGYLWNRVSTQVVSSGSCADALAVTVTFDALVTLRSDLQLLRQVGMAPPNWAAHVVSSITRSIKSEGAGPTVDVLMGEVLAPSMPDQSQEWNDSLPQLLTYPLVTRIGNSETPLLVPLIIDYLPELLDRRVDQYLPRNISAFALLIRSSLLVLLEIDASLANHLATALVDEMTYQLARSVDDAGSKKPRTIRGARGISTGSRAIVERLKVVMGDEEVKGKLEACKRLEG